MQFTAMTVHVEIDYLLNTVVNKPTTCSWKIIAKRCTIKKE